MRALALTMMLFACTGDGPAGVDSASDSATDTGSSDTGSSDTGNVTPTLGFGVDANADHTCVHISTGALHCWGRGHVGQLGLASSEDLGDNEDPKPSRVDVGANVVGVTLGTSHTCALTEAGDVKCWGLADLGQLGYGNTDEVGLTNSPSAVGAVAIGGTAVEISAGDRYTCARLDGGDVRCWGLDAGGRLGQATNQYIGDNETPDSIPVVDLGGPAVRLAVGTAHACAILQDRSLRCWGEGPATGHGPAATYVGDDETPASAGDPLGVAVDDVWVGSRTTCAQITGGGLRCWGDGNDYELGRPGPVGQENFGVEEVVEDPANGPEHDFGAKVIDMALGIHYSCALLETGAVKCWGQHWDGVLGRGEVGSLRVAVDAPDVALGGSATALAGESLHNCALIGESGDLTCWGEGVYGKLGQNGVDDIGDDETPASVGSVVYQ
ncbi:MAG: hypothetical protein KC912_26175 [Proteobacteria bacterium]|nr:hypothetical protein [Pseudomonadota bacterium]